ncbi:leucine-rich repeat receptor-like protein kinase TDR isoform X2 [Phoenix dactylifera]|uniref:non-specific serine/threonine protein kinase n=1 Tax=Phoenix dactylifera TaxID=42345 RepID=A0A8B8Z9I2_PHODC|nr:leucine-rich repeat receptor-like protein kinase TDR isoform X2 [Phoenix dactylifera]
MSSRASTALLLLATITAVTFSNAAAPATPPLLALLSLKSSLVDPTSSFQDWSYPSASAAGPPPWCSWSGVTCSAAGEVTALDLSRRNLSGDISPKVRLLSSSLTHLNLSGNAFRGALPSVIFDLRLLQTLDLSHNDFNSSFPAAVAALRHLTLLDAYSNSFNGLVPPGLAKLGLLEHLNLGGSFFEGGIPTGLGSLPRLRFLHLSGNLLTGRLPHQLGLLSQLEHLEIGYNSYEGGVPPELGGLAGLRYLDISSANLSGQVPPELGNLTRLESLFLFKNRLSGRIPASIFGMGALKVLDLSDNRLSGSIPAGLSTLGNLTLLSLMNNELTGEIPPGIGELPNLEALLLWNNSLTGALPQKLGSGGRLQKLDVSSNSLTGPIPPGLCSGNRLVRLILFSNRFDSEIPPGLANCSSLWRIRIEGNRHSGPIPSGFGSLPNLTYMDLSSNNLSGGIPSDLGTAPRLEFLNVSGNPLRRPLPETIWSAPRLQILSASYCDLDGEIPNFENGCRNLYKIEMEGNDLRGEIPTDIGRCTKLLSLRLGRNRLTGAIPEDLTALPSITDVDLSWNALTGPIPPAFDNCSTLESFNVSFNHLAGEVSSAGAVLRNLPPSAFAGNNGLCGGPVGRPCAAGGREEAPPARGSAGAAVVWIAAGAVGAGLVVLILGTRWFREREEEGPGPRGPGPWRLTAFQRLNFTAEDVAECVAGSDRIIGVGSMGTVYRAEMPGGEIIAVKKLWGPQKEAGRMMRKKGGVAAAEVEVLGSVRHRNIVRLLGYCTNRETTLLLYEYMPNGSLEDLLHGRGGGAAAGKGGCMVTDWETRYRIAVGIAQGICYLHHDCDPVIVHRDLKPSNILLDAEMEARVADFGVAKLIQAANQTMSVIAGSYGYIAPEYAYTLQVDEKSDVYSYGVVLTEMVTGRRSVEAEYGEGKSIVEWVRARVARGEGGGAWKVLDPLAAGCKEVREEMMLVFRLALLCTSKNPADRPTMRDVLSMLREAIPSRKVLVAGKQQGGGGGGGSPAAVVQQTVGTHHTVDQIYGLPFLCLSLNKLQETRDGCH